MFEDMSKAELIQKIILLEKENKELKELVYGKSDDVQKDMPKQEVNISNNEKVKIFMDIFKGRADIYAKRYDSKVTGKSGYVPACNNDFVKFKCNKPKIKCSECINRAFIPLTEEVVLKHLKGEITIGIYPLLQDDTCTFLAIDFDERTYEKDVAMFWSLCDELDVPIYVERSRSGNGAHVWIFFEENISAKSARKMGNILLSKTMEKTNLKLNSYDKLFPNQDAMPKGGFGNLIALPFQGESSKLGNTVFVNKYFEVEKNQFDILVNIKRMRVEQVYEIITKYSNEDYSENVFYNGVDEDGEDEIPKKENIKDTIFSNNVECIFDNKIYIKKLKLLPNEVNYLKRLASFINPEYYEKQRLRLPLYNTARIISSFEEDDRYLILPRGCFDSIKQICEKSNVKLIVKDTREKGVLTDFEFNGELNEKQQNSMNKLTEHDVGILCASTGFGKTVISANIISKFKTNALILVNRNTLLEQWKERLSYFLNIDKKEIGQLGASKDTLNGVLDIAGFQSLYKRDNMEELLKGYGLVIVDECHHVAAFTFEKVLKAVRAKHVYGLTATPTRKDGWQRVGYMQCGDIRVRVSNKKALQEKGIEHIVIAKRTNYKYIPYGEDKAQISDIYNDMCNNVFRNSIIIDDIKECIKEGRIPLVLSERVEHLNILKESLDGLDVPVVIYKGHMGKKQTKVAKEILEEADMQGKPRVILATSSFIGEGFDDSRLDTLFLTMPVSWKGRIIQYVGRLHRQHDSKDKIVVYDYIDNMKVLSGMYKNRVKTYKDMGYEIKEKW